MFPYEHTPPGETQYCDNKSLRDLLILESINGKANDGTSFDDNPGAVSCVSSFSNTSESTKSMETSPSDTSFDNEAGVNGTNSKILNGIRYLNSSPQQLDPNGDFSYSQKLFHIADGNLYSIFSPLQGRSYGVKPSFLRKQKCTVQECHAKGKKHMRKGLKFHNFLPSESVTSEKDNNILDKWKVHSECRLREEHGTKQIVISNWSSNLESSGELNDDEEAAKNYKGQICTDPENEVPLYTSCTIKAPNHHSSIFDSKGNFQSCFNGINSEFSSDFSSQGNVLQTSQENSFQLERNASDSIKFGNSLLNEMLYSVENSASKSNHIDFCTSAKKDQQAYSESGKKHRRKPFQTRRVVPYIKYLSLMDEIESSPLDLSAKSSNSVMGTENDGSTVQLSRGTPGHMSETEDMIFPNAHSTDNCRIASEVPFTNMPNELLLSKSLNNKESKLVMNDVPVSYSVPVMQGQFYPSQNLNACKSSSVLPVNKVPFSGQSGHFILNKHREFSW